MISKEEVGKEMSPGDLFVTLWEAAQSWSPSDRANTTAPSQAFISAIRGALSGSIREEVYQALKSALAMPASSEAAFRGQILTAMHEIDKAFYAIHPRAASIAPSQGGHSPLPYWLVLAREARQIFGYYSAASGSRLIARGPLCRASRNPTAANADSLSDRFMALEVVPMVLSQSGREISVVHKLVPTDAARGVEPSRRTGHETVVFLPVAEELEDIVKTEIVRGEQRFVDFRAANDFKAAERIIHALSSAGVADIAIASELIVNEDEADKLSDSLLAGSIGPRILISGSGPTRATKNDQAWNEARILNGCGSELWRQQKIWPAGITKGLAGDYGLSDPGDGQILEDTAAGDRLTVIDADGIGRCVVLICQDLQARPFTDDLLRLFQPDWVFIPVMDYGVDIGRWSHRRASELSVLSQARFIVVSSLTLARWKGMKKTPPCGLAIGPASPATVSDEPTFDEERAVRTAHSDPAEKPGYATLTWRSEGWKKTVVTAE